MTKNIIVTLTALLAIAAVTFIYAGSYLLAPSLHMVGSPPVDLEARSVVFDGVSGWLLKGSNVPGSCVLLMHSVHSDRRSMISRARFFKSRGYSVLLIDFQAHGESPGELITFGYRESRNAHAALNFLKNEVTCQHTYAIGQSMGGAAALLGEFPLPVDGMILESVYPSIEMAVADRLELKLGKGGRLIAPLFYMQIPFRFGIPIAALQPARAIRNIKCPVLVIAGNRDLHTHLTESKLLFGNAPNPKRQWIVEGAGHEDMYAFAGIEYERVVSTFLKSTGVEVPYKSFQVNP